MTALETKLKEIEERRFIYDENKRFIFRELREAHAALRVMARITIMKNSDCPTCDFGPLQATKHDSECPWRCARDYFTAAEARAKGTG